MFDLLYPIHLQSLGIDGRDVDMVGTCQDGTDVTDKVPCFSLLFLCTWHSYVGNMRQDHEAVRGALRNEIAKRLNNTGLPSGKGLS